MLPTKFQINWLSGFRGEEFFKLANQKQESPVVAMFVISIENLPQMLPTKFPIIWPNTFRGEESKKSANQKQELPVVAMFVNRLGPNEHS